MSYTPNPEMVAERERIVPYLEAAPDKTLALLVEMDFDAPEGATEYCCPMDPEIVSDEPGKWPKCAMRLMPRAAAVVYTCPMHPEVISDEPGKCPKCAMKLMPRAARGGDTPAQHGWEVRGTTVSVRTARCAGSRSASRIDRAPRAQPADARRARRQRYITRVSAGLAARIFKRRRLFPDECVIRVLTDDIRVSSHARQGD